MACTVLSVWWQMPQCLRWHLSVVRGHRVHIFPKRYSLLTPWFSKYLLSSWCVPSIELVARKININKTGSLSLWSVLTAEISCHICNYFFGVTKLWESPKGLGIESICKLFTWNISLHFSSSCKGWGFVCCFSVETVLAPKELWMLFVVVIWLIGITLKRQLNIKNNLCFDVKSRGFWRPVRVLVEMDQPVPFLRHRHEVCTWPGPSCRRTPWTSVLLILFPEINDERWQSHSLSSDCDNRGWGWAAWTVWNQSQNWLGRNLLGAGMGKWLLPVFISV